MATSRQRQRRQQRRAAHQHHTRPRPVIRRAWELAWEVVPTPMTHETMERRTVADLKAEATERGIAVKSRARKSEVIDALLAA